MIILKYLRANNFKSLRSVHLLFPERGSVLIEGQNEAGKSTLFEAVYVALYGKPLVGEETVARQDEVIQHGQTSAIVQLAFSVGQQALTVTRHFERGRAQQATLKIQRPGTPEEVIQRARAVNDRVLKELGNLDGDSLRNSCFVEQKELGRIEDLVPADRERAVQKLLGLDRLTRMMDELRFKREQRVELELAEHRLQLAQLQAEGEAATARETELAERLDAVKIAGHMRRLGGLAVQRAELEAALDACALRVQHARDRLTRCVELKQQIASCDQISQRLMAIDHAREELSRSEGELARLECIEQVELPTARTHLSDISAAAEAVAQTARARQSVKQAKELLRLQMEIHQRESEAQSAETAASHAEQEMQRAMNLARLATVYEALTAWIRLKLVETVISGYVMQQSLLFTKQQVAETAFVAARSKTHMPLYTAVSLTILALLALILVTLWLPALIISLCLLCGSIVFWLRFVRARRNVQMHSAELTQCKGELESLDMQRQAAIQTGGDPTSLKYYEQQLQQASIKIPSDFKAGESLQEELRRRLGAMPEPHVLQETARVARDDHIRLTEQLRQARIVVEKSRKALSEYERTIISLIQEDETVQTKALEALRLVRDLIAMRQAGDPATQLARTQDALSKTEILCHQQEEAMRLLLQKVDMQTETAVEPERGRAEERVQSLEKDWTKYPSLQEEYQEQKTSFSQALVSTSTQLQDLLDACQHLEVTGLPSLLMMQDKRESAFPYEQALRTTLNAIRSVLQSALIAMDESGTRAALEATLGEQGQIEQQIKSNEADVQQTQQAIVTILTRRSLTTPPMYTFDSLIACWPLIAAVSPDEDIQATNELEQVRKDLYAIGQQVRSLTDELHHPGTPLDIDECQQKVYGLREERQICEWAAKFIQETRDRIARHVLPITERNMQPLLQQLTGGRYRDVRLTPEESNGQSSTMDYRIRVWDSAAMRFVAKNLFSGGTRDQCSLALRLAFALATLPQELGVAPGFIFLDEPLSAFDAQRAQALVELLTTGIIAQQFNQVVLISHSHAFDRDAFHYHVRMEGGQVVESDLPQEEPEREELAV
jgi:DNA repair exonuclease SbcCD ATPase subunit